MRRNSKKLFAIILAAMVGFQSLSMQAFAEEKETSTSIVELVGEETASEESSGVEEAASEESSSVEEVASEEETTCEESSSVEETAGEESSSEETTVIEEETTESVYQGENFKVTFQLANKWDGGYQVAVRIDNTSDEVIHDWLLECNMDYEIINIWNAQIFEQNIVKNAVWNQDIYPHSSVEFGFQGNNTFPGFPTEYKLLGACEENKKEDYSVEYVLDSDWGSGFTGRISITNNTEETIEDWVLTFDFARDITSIWNGVIESKADGHYVIKNADYNCNIMPGQTVSFGFIGENGNSADTPTNYVLSSYVPYATPSKVKIELPVEEALQEKAAAGLVVIATFDEEKNVISMLDTSYDEEGKLAYTFVDPSEADKTYILVDAMAFTKDMMLDNPESVSHTKEADIIFVIDGTGSMGSTISRLKASMMTFEKILNANDIAPRFGIVEFGDITVTSKGKREITQCYGWFSDATAFVNKVNEVGSPVYYGGDSPESQLDGLYVAMNNLEMRPEAHQFMILVTDATYKIGIEGNKDYNMQNAIEDVLEKGITTSAIQRKGDNSYNDITSATKGAISYISETRYLTEKDAVTLNILQHIDRDCWIRLADGRKVKLDKDPRLGDTSVDTDGDGIPDLEELCSMVSIQVLNPETMQMETVEAWSYVSDPIKK